MQIRQRNQITIFSLNFDMQQVHLGYTTKIVRHTDEITGTTITERLEHESGHCIADDGRTGKRDGGAEQDSQKAEQLPLSFITERQQNYRERYEKQVDANHNQLAMVLLTGFIGVKREQAFVYKVNRSSEREDKHAGKPQCPQLFEDIRCRVHLLHSPFTRRET